MRFLFVALCFLVLPASHAIAERRVALVIGNQQYERVAPLDNPRNDADAIAAALKRMDFEVLKGVDLDQRGMQGLIRDFSTLLIGADVALFYYAGHGIQVNGENYLIPTDAHLQDEADLDFATVKFNLIVRQMEREPRVKLLFLDACRDNPFKDQLARGMSQTRATGRVADGLAKIDVNSAGGTLIAFATDPGALAMDGSGQQNSPFTTALLEHIDRPGLEIHSMMIDVRSAVWEQTRERQRPWSNSSLTGKFFFRPTQEAPVVLALNAHGDAAPKPAEPSAKTPQTSPDDPAIAAEIELEFWRSASTGNTVEEYEVYLRAYPDGKFAPIARARLKKLDETAEVPDAPQEPVEGATKGLSAITPIEGAAQDMATTGGTPEELEEALALSRAERRELQHRLRLAGFNPGGADGMLGPRSRSAIAAWQSANSLPETGYMTGEALSRLGTETETAYVAYKADYAKRQRARTTQRTATRSQPAPEQREGSHLGSAFRKIGHGVRDIFR